MRKKSGKTKQTASERRLEVAARVRAARAAALIRKDGWRQHTMGGGGGPVCLVGAIDSVGPRGPSARVLERLLNLGIRCRDSDMVRGNLMVWNDSLSRRKSDVLRLLDRVARGAS